MYINVKGLQNIFDFIQFMGIGDRIDFLPGLTVKQSFDIGSILQNFFSPRGLIVFYALARAKCVGFILVPFAMSHN